MKLFSLVVLIMILNPTSSYAIPSLNSNDRKECIQRVQIECRSGISRVDRAFFTYDHGYIWNMRLKNGGSAFCARQVFVDWMDKTSSPPPATQVLTTVRCFAFE